MQAPDPENDDPQTSEGTRRPRTDEGEPEVEGHMPRIRWGHNEQPAASLPTTPRRRPLRRTLIATLAAALAVSVLASAASAASGAGFTLPDGGSIGMSVRCGPARGSPPAAGRTWKDSSYTVYYRYYVETGLPRLDPAGATRATLGRWASIPS